MQTSGCASRLWRRILAEKLQQLERQSDDHRPQEQPHHTECRQAPEYADEDRHGRYLTATGNKQGFQQVVDGTHHARAEREQQGGG